MINKETWGQRSINSGRKSMIFLIAKKPCGINVVRCIGTERVTKTQNSSMLGRLTERKRTLSLGSRMMLVSGMKVNLILQPLLWLILRKSTPPLVPLE